MLKAFRDFVMRGNVMDLAIAVILGAAFGKVISSFVADILMPPIGLLLGHVDFSNLFLDLSGQHFATLADARKAGAPTLNYGVFVNQVIDFTIVAFAIFLMVQALQRLQRKEAPAAPEPAKKCPFCLSPNAPAATRCAHCTSAI